MILLLACDHVAPHNRVTIDRRGRPIVHYRFGPEVVRALCRGMVVSARIFFAAGAVRVHVPLAEGPTVEASDSERLDNLSERDFKPGKVSVSAAHLMGGCAMGRSPSDSVTDSRGRVHGLPRLFIADSSLFPDSVEINPYLTIMALADRVAEGIRKDAGALLS